MIKHNRWYRSWLTGGMFKPQFQTPQAVIGYAISCHPNRTIMSHKENWDIALDTFEKYWVETKNLLLD